MSQNPRQLTEQVLPPELWKLRPQLVQWHDSRQIRRVLRRARGGTWISMRSLLARVGQNSRSQPPAVDTNMLAEATLGPKP